MTKRSQKVLCFQQTWPWRPGRVILLLLLWAAAASPQPTKWPIESLHVEGNRLYTEQQVLALTGLKIGQQAEKAAFEAARDRLLAAGVFESVGYRYAPSPSGKGYAVTFEVAEVEQVFPIQFDFFPVPGAELRAELKRRDPLFGEKVPGAETVLQRYARIIEDYLKQKNFEQQVIGRITADTPGQIYILFRPASAQAVIAEVHFTGNQVIPSTALQNAIRGVAIGVEYRETRFRQLLDASVRPLYEARGRVRMAFPKIETSPAKDVKGLAVTVQVEEGVSYDLGQVRVEGTQTLDQELNRAAKLEPGDMADFDEVKAALGRIEARMRREGYMLAKARAEREIDDDFKVVNLVLRVEAGPQFVFGKLHIKGLTVHGEAEVKRLWGLDPGKPFNADYPEYFLQRIREDGVFDNLKKTSSVIQTDEKSLTVDVTLVFQ